MLEVKLALPEGEDPPLWVQELLDSGLVHEVNKFSKFLHGTATLMPESVQHAPYWFDDASIRPSIMAARMPLAFRFGSQTRRAGFQNFGTELTESSSSFKFTVGSFKSRTSATKDMLETLVSADAQGSESGSFPGSDHPFQPVRNIPPGHACASGRLTGRTFSSRAHDTKMYAAQVSRVVVLVIRVVIHRGSGTVHSCCTRRGCSVKAALASVKEDTHSTAAGEGIRRRRCTGSGR